MQSGEKTELLPVLATFHRTHDANTVFCSHIPSTHTIVLLEKIGVQNLFIIVIFCIYFRLLQLPVAASVATYFAYEYTTRVRARMYHVCASSIVDTAEVCFAANANAASYMIVYVFVSAAFLNLGAPQGRQSTARRLYNRRDHILPELI